MRAADFQASSRALSQAQKRNYVSPCRIPRVPLLCGDCVLPVAVPPSVHPLFSFAQETSLASPRPIILDRGPAIASLPLFPALNPILASLRNRARGFDAIMPDSFPAACSLMRAAVVPYAVVLRAESMLGRILTGALEDQTRLHLLEEHA